MTNLICYDNIEFQAIALNDDGGLTIPNIFGLAPKENSVRSSAPSYIKALKAHNAIKKEEVTLFLNVNTTLLNCTTCSIMSFGGDRTDEDLYTTGEWYNHRWTFTDDFGVSLAALAVLDASYGDVSFAPGSTNVYKAIVATSSPTLLTLPKNNPNAFASFKNAIIDQFGAANI